MHSLLSPHDEVSSGSASPVDVPCAAAVAAALAMSTAVAAQAAHQQQHTLLAVQQAAAATANNHSAIAVPTHFSFASSAPSSASSSSSSPFAPSASVQHSAVPDGSTVDPIPHSSSAVAVNGHSTSHATHQSTTQPLPSISSTHSRITAASSTSTYLPGDSSNSSSNSDSPPTSGMSAGHSLATSSTATPVSSSPLFSPQAVRHSPSPLLSDPPTPTSSNEPLTRPASSTLTDHSSFNRSVSAPTPAPSAASSVSSASSSSSSSSQPARPPVVLRAVSMSPSLNGRESGGERRSSGSRPGSTQQSTRSLPASAPSSSHAVPAVQRLLSLRSAYLSASGQSSANGHSSPAHSAEAYSPTAHSDSDSLASQLPSAQTGSVLSPASRLPRTLRFAFSSPELECRYQSDYSARYFKPLRRVVLACVTIWVLFVINDAWQHHLGRRRNIEATLSLRFAVAGVVACSTLTSYHRSVKARIGPRVLRWTVAGYIVLFGTCQVIFGLIEINTAEPTYCDFIILLAAMSASLFRLPFVLSTACNVLLFLVFVVLTVSQSAWDSERDFLASMAWLATALVLFTFNGYTVERSMRSTFFAAEQLASQEANSQRVLATMLPAQVLAELRMSKSAFVYENHSSVSVLFSHIHHFDQHTASLQATAIVELLNELFSQFDHLTDHFKVYKVETIGDVYLVSGGVPDPLEPHASIVCLLALAMMEETNRLLASRRLQLRIGVHSGSVIAGVVGMKYPRYRLMGDTVNTASRMSTTCEANDIQISAATFSRLAPEFVCQYHGQRKVKGKGAMDTYLLRGVSSPQASAAASSAFTPLQSWSPHAQAVREDEKEEPQYHSTPQPSQLYSNEALSPLQEVIVADDPAAILRDRDMGRTVHRVRHASSGGVASDGSREQRAEFDQKEPSRPLQRLVSRTSLQRQSSSEFDDRLSPPPTFSSLQSRPSPTIRVPSLSLSPHQSQPGSQSQSRAHSPSLSPSTSQLSLDALASSPSPLSVQTPHSVTSTVPGTPSSVSSPNGFGEYPSYSSSLDLLVSPPRSPSTTYTLSAERVRDTFLSQSTQAAALLAHFRWTVVDGSHSAFSASSRSLLRSRLAHPVQSLYELLWTLVSQFRPAFEGDALLKSEFQAHWSRRTVNASRLGFAVFVYGLLILGVLECALAGFHINWLTWSVRAAAMSIGLAVLLLSYSHQAVFSRWQQRLVAVSWMVMTMLTIGVSMLVRNNTKLYGVSITILLVTTSSFFVGLQFRWFSFTALPILLLYFVAALSIEDEGGSRLNSFFLLAAVCLSMMSAHAAEHFARLDFIRHRTLNEEEAKTRYILDNMLPKSVMDQLVRQHATGNHSIIAQHCERAAVLFCDIVQFTALAAVIRAEDVVAILNVLFSAFDALTTLHGVYKVETIGDAYLACSGVVDSGSSESRQYNHVEALVLCALDFLSASHHCRTPDDQPLQLRIGIHTGTVVAGVIGRKMPRYHLFGETVTIAEETEQGGVADAVVISGSTHQHCHRSIVCRPLAPLGRSSSASSMPRYLVLGVASGSRRREYADSERAGVGLDLSALPQVVVDILQKVRAEAAGHDEAAAGGSVSIPIAAAVEAEAGGAAPSWRSRRRASRVQLQDGQQLSTPLLGVNS